MLLHFLLLKNASYQGLTNLLLTDKNRKLQYKTRRKMGQLVNIDDIKKLYPDEWVLIGNPIMDDRHIDVLSGIPIYHSKDKKEVCYIGRDKTSDFDKITLIFTGSFKPSRKITGIFNRIKK